MYWGYDGEMSIQYKIISKFYDLIDVFYFNQKSSNPRFAMLDFIPDEYQLSPRSRKLGMCIEIGRRLFASLFLVFIKKDLDVYILN